jgi:leucyl/phenylalanyl-tRNA--protein transferase
MNQKSRFETNRIKFPPVEFADADGLLAMGGNLEPETLVEAYSNGIFPWTARPITWWSPDPRAVFDMNSFCLSKRMQRLYRTGRFSFSINQNFAEVIQGCARPGPGREDTWISEEFVRAYTRMHELGLAHSCEVWYENKLAGGIYGVALGGFFAGESMFHLVTNASTMGLKFLIDYLKNRGFVLFDSQVITPHTKKLGAIEIDRKTYLEKLRYALKLEVKIEKFEKK